MKTTHSLTSLLIALSLFSSVKAAELMIEKKNRSENEWAVVIKDNILFVLEEEKEFTLPAGQRIDLFDEHNNIAYEIDWAYKWTEAIGQSLIYKIKTNSNPGVILLMKTGEDEHYLNAINVINDLRSHGYNYEFIVINIDTYKYWRF